MGRKITMFRITSIILLLALAFQLNAQSLLLFEDEYELNSIPGLQLLVLPNRDLAGGWTSDNKVVQDYSQGGKVYGSELVTNGGFDTDTNWSKGSGWSISGGKATYDGLANANIINSGSFTLSTSEKVRMTFTISGSASSASIAITNQLGLLILANSTYSNGTHFIEFAPASSATSVGIRAYSAGGSFNIDNVSFQKITGGNHGIYKNSMELNQTAGLKYYTFDGTDDYASLGNVLNLQDNFTLMALFKQNGEPVNTGNSFLNKWLFTTNNRSYYFGFYESKLSAWFSDNGINVNVQTVGDSNDYTDNTSYLYGVSKNASTYIHSVNGVQKIYTNAVGSEYGSLYQTTRECVIGMFAGIVADSDMKIGAIIVANSVLTPAQQKQIYYSVEVQSIIAGM